MHWDKLKAYDFPYELLALSYKKVYSIVNNDNIIAEKKIDNN